MKTVELRREPSNVLDLIRKGDRVFMRELYQRHRKEFDSWAAKHFRADREMSGEVYQQAFITLFYNVRDGRLCELKSSVKTYLFAIGKNLFRDQYKTGRKFTDSVEDVDPGEIDNSLVKEYEQEELRETVREMLDRIGEPCKTVLHLFYFKHYTMDSIAAELNYKTEQIAAKRKFICLKQMNKMITEQGIDLT